MVTPITTEHGGRCTLAVRPLALALGILVSGYGCGGPGVSGNFKLVQFEAPSYPDAKLREILDSVETIGVVSATGVEPLQGLDTEKVMGRLTDATASSLRRLPDRRVVTNDEIQQVMNKLNHRPRKTLGFWTPHEVFSKTKTSLTTVAQSSIREVKLRIQS